VGCLKSRNAYNVLDRPEDELEGVVLNNHESVPLFTVNWAEEKKNNKDIVS